MSLKKLKGYFCKQIYYSFEHYFYGDNKKNTVIISYVCTYILVYVQYISVIYTHALA